MITMDRLLQILDDWALSHKHYKPKTGYPTKSLGMISGGESTNEAFDDMYDSSLKKPNIDTIDAIIHELPKEQKEAIYFKYLKGNKPLFYEYKLDLAMDNLLTIASRRINA